jgi:hypothetical protein
VTGRALTTNAASAAHQPFPPVADPVLPFAVIYHGAPHRGDSNLSGGPELPTMESARKVIAEKLSETVVERIKAADQDVVVWHVSRGQM